MLQFQRDTDVGPALNPQASPSPPSRGTPVRQDAGAHARAVGGVGRGRAAPRARTAPRPRRRLGSGARVQGCRVPALSAPPPAFPCSWPSSRNDQRLFESSGPTRSALSHTRPSPAPPEASRGDGGTAHRVTVAGPSAQPPDGRLAASARSPRRAPAWRRPRSRDVPRGEKPNTVSLQVAEPEPGRERQEADPGFLTQRAASEPGSLAGWKLSAISQDLDMAAGPALGQS